MKDAQTRYKNRAEIIRNTCENEIVINYNYDPKDPCWLEIEITVIF